ncbi:MAG TPA: FHA domain-containing protein [Tepidisphaeraceae bacterium]|jgi:pSer/pThr/pTyr-binding forkhead associated (FHA) protein
MQVVLAMFRSDGDRRSFSLHKDLTIIGRREDCDLRIPLGEISRKHCRLIKENDALRVEDLGSSNGTYHNGERIQEAVIQAGDTIQVGSIAFVVQIDGVPADDELQPTLAQTAVEASGSAAGENGTIGGSGSHAPATDEAVVEVEGEPGEFDPMAILENADSNVDGDALGIDIEEQSHHGQSAEA